MQTTHDQVADLAKREFARRCAADEQVIRALLGRWVSEIEPCVARDRDLRVIGLAAADRIVIRLDDV